MGLLVDHTAKLQRLKFHMVYFFLWVRFQFEAHTKSSKNKLRTFVYKKSTARVLLIILLSIFFVAHIVYLYRSNQFTASFWDSFQVNLFSDVLMLIFVALFVDKFLDKERVENYQNYNQIVNSKIENCLSNFASGSLRILNRSFKRESAISIYNSLSNKKLLILCLTKIPENEKFLDESIKLAKKLRFELASNINDFYPKENFRLLLFSNNLRYYIKFLESTKHQLTKGINLEIFNDGFSDDWYNVLYFRKEFKAISKLASQNLLFSK